MPYGDQDGDGVHLLGFLRARTLDNLAHTERTVVMPGFAEFTSGGPPEGLPQSFATAPLVFAFTEVASRREALRTRVITTADGPRQVIDPASTAAAAVQDVPSAADPVAAIAVWRRPASTA